MEKERHPKGLYVLFFTEMWERFGFYSMLAMFTLYLRNEKQGFGWSTSEAVGLYSNYLMLVYASPLIGGWLADRKLGYRNSVLLGGLIFMVGYFLLGIHALWAVYTALACLVVGNGFFKPNVSAMVGHLYPEGSHLKDRAYNIFYMGINIGALLAPINAEFMVRLHGFNVAFMVAGVGMIVSVIILWTFRRHVTGVTHEPQGSEAETAGTGQPVRHNAMEAVPEWKRITALIVVYIIAIVFWMVFHQNGSTLTYWADDNTDWEVTGIISNAINPFWVVTLTFPLVWLWHWLDKRGLEPSTPTKMAFGMFLCAASFGVLYLAAHQAEGKEVSSEAYVQGSFRVVDQTLDQLRAAGVPEDVLRKLGQTKDSQKKFIVKGRKFSPDRTCEKALETIKDDLHSQGIDDKGWSILKDAEFGADVKDQPLTKGKFGEDLARLVKELRQKGLPEEDATKILADKDHSFTGEEKLSHAVSRVLTPEEASKYQGVIEEKAYLYQVSPWWLILAYAVVTLGELMLSPMGLSLVSKVAPARLRGVMMGGWFAATAIGSKLTMIGVYWDRWLHSTFFIILASMAFVMGLVLVLLLRPLKRAMPGV
jgi:proton-dependent oligopeptide transporter, POT family